MQAGYESFAFFTFRGGSRDEATTAFVFDCEGDPACCRSDISPSLVINTVTFVDVTFVDVETGGVYNDTKLKVMDGVDWPVKPRLTVYNFNVEPLENRRGEIGVSEYFGGPYEFRQISVFNFRAQDIPLASQASPVFAGSGGNLEVCPSAMRCCHSHGMVGWPPCFGAVPRVYIF